MTILLKIVLIMKGGTPRLVILTQKLILSVFEPEEAKRAVKVHADIEAVTGNKVAIGRLYPKLRRLENNGFLESWDDFSDKETLTNRLGHPPRLYRLTGKGFFEKNRKIRKHAGLGKLIPSSTQRSSLNR